MPWGWELVGAWLRLPKLDAYCKLPPNVGRCLSKSPPVKLSTGEDDKNMKEWNIAGHM